MIDGEASRLLSILDLRSSPRDSIDEESRELLQRRLALFTLAMFGIFAFAGAGDFLLVALHALPEELGTSYALPVRATLIAVGLLVISARCRFGRRLSRRELRVLDAATAILTCAALVLLLMYLGSRLEASMGLALGTAYVLMARSVMVPSSGRRTFLLSLAAMLVPTIAAVELRIQDLGRAPAANDYLLEGFAAFRFAVITIALSSLGSEVIYGLRRRARENATIGQYVLHEKIGQGGMGSVYRATHAMLRKDTAIKLFSPKKIGETALARFQREVVLTAQLSHPNTVSVFDYGRTPDGTFYYVMELLPGGDLQELVDFAGPLPAGRVIFIVEQVCRALREAHGFGLIHRDIKPSNILVCERGGEADVAKVVDFGLVKDLGARGDGSLTAAGALTGTPQYMAPEIILSQAADARTDLYSLGASAYFLLTGAPPFAGANLVEIAAHHLHTVPSPPSVRVANVPGDLEATILRCLAKTPDARFADTSELLASLRSSTASSSWTASDAATWWRTNRDSFHAHREKRRADRCAQPDGLPVNGKVAVDLADHGCPAWPRRQADPGPSVPAAGQLALPAKRG
jgi:serine/threonine-protein kinase